jgi:RimJ/RimL family protein N-acetyltransferase
MSLVRQAELGWGPAAVWGRIGSMRALVQPDDILEAGLRVRPWRADDADAVYRACQDPLIQRWTNVPRPYLPEHAEGFVAAFTKQSWTTGSAAPFGVFDAVTGGMLGSTGLVTINLVKAEAEIGYWTAPWARGRGCATAAARAVARWALDGLGLTRLIWRAEVGNHASRLVAEHIGVRVEGLLRHAITRPGGFPTDAWTGSLLPGQLRESAVPTDPAATARARTFSGPQPRLTRLTERSTGAEGGRPVALRSPQWGDIAGIVSACQDPESARWTTVPAPYRTVDAEYFVGGHAPGLWLRGEGAVFAITDPDDAFAGSMELRLTGPRTASVGYLMAPWARGRGYATAALRAACLWGFESLGLHRIEWQAYVGNEASRRVAQRAGFTLEGVARAGCLQRGEYRDAWTGALLASDPR